LFEKKSLILFVCLFWLPFPALSEQTVLPYIEYQNPVLEFGILFVHGTPGSKSGFERYVEDEDLRKVASMISVDRLGFGKTKSEAVTTFKEHSESIYNTIYPTFKNKKVVCVGHSYGSPLCLDLMARYPDLFAKSVVIAGAFNPNRRILRWYNSVAKTWPISAVLSRAFSNSNKEMYGLKAELDILSEKLPQIKKPVLVLHGEKDRIVPFADSEWLYERIKSNNIQNDFNRFERDGHFIIWKNQERVKKDIINFLEKGL
jgi:pimeloyl-ACP methyl ester carboxylesterase